MTATQIKKPETAPAPSFPGQAPQDGGFPRQAPEGVGSPDPAREGPGSPGQAPEGAGSPGRAPEGPGSAGRGPDMAAALRPLLVDIGIPLGTYYLLRDAFGVSLWLSLALSSIGPVVRAVAGLVAQRRVNVLAALMLAVNLAGIVVSFLTGDARAMIAKDSIVSSVIAFAILGSVALRRPLMSAGLKPFMTKGEPRRTAAWDRLSTASPRFRRLERLFSAIWGLVLLAECATRLVGAYTLPVTTMVWLSTAMALGAIGVAVIAGGAAAAPIQKMIDAEAAAC